MDNPVDKFADRFAPKSARSAEFQSKLNC